MSRGDLAMTIAMAVIGLLACVLLLIMLTANPTYIHH